MIHETLNNIVSNDFAYLSQVQPALNNAAGIIDVLDRLQVRRSDIYTLVGPSIYTPYLLRNLVLLPLVYTWSLSSYLGRWVVLYLSSYVIGSWVSAPLHGLICISSTPPFRRAGFP